jgi:hypothetical protein
MSLHDIGWRRAWKHPTIQVLERNTGMLWVIEVFHWKHDKASCLIVATEANSGCTTKREASDWNAKKISLDVVSLLGGHRRNGEWLLRAGVDVPGWRNESIEFYTCVRRVL